MKQFLDTVREVRALRQEVEEELMTVHGAFTVACLLYTSEHGDGDVLPACL